MSEKPVLSVVPCFNEALCCGVAFVALLFVFLRALLFGASVGGGLSRVCVIVFLFGLQLFVVDFLGANLPKTNLEPKRHPAYRIKEEM